MPREKEGRKMTRREFLAGGAALAWSAFLSGCGLTEEPSSAQKPSPRTETKPSVSPALTAEPIPTIIPSTKVPTKTPEATSTPEPTPTQEVLKFPGLIISEDYLKGAFANVGGGEVIESGQQETTVVEFGQNYVSQSWGEEINFTSLPEDSIASLKYLVSLGAYQGAEGVFTPGKQGEEVVFPQLADLSFPRLTLNEVPSKADQGNQEFREWTTPQNFLLHSGTQATVVGVFKEPRPAEATIVDKDTRPEDQLDYALVAFTDYLRAGEDNIPRHYLAILPTRFPADPDNKQAFSLANLLEANGYRYDYQREEIVFGDKDGRQVRLGLNNLEGEELIKKVKQETGIYFVDQLKGELIKNPVVPYPDEMPKAWTIEETVDEAGNVTLLLKSQDQKGNLQDFARARHNPEKEEWVWEEIGYYEGRETDFVGVSEVSPEMLQECVDQGFVCLPLPCHPEGVKAAEFLPFYKGPDPKNEDREIEQGLFGIDLKPGTVVVAPFTGEMSWSLSTVCNEKLYDEKKWDKSEFPGWECYGFFFRAYLPSGKVIDLEFWPGEVEILAPESNHNSGLEPAVFPLHSISAGTPIFRYIGSPGREVHPVIKVWGHYNRDEQYWIKQNIHHGLMIEGHCSFPDERSGYRQNIKILEDGNSKLVYILPKE